MLAGERLELKAVVLGHADAEARVARLPVVSERHLKEFHVRPLADDYAEVRQVGFPYGREWRDWLCGPPGRNTDLFWQGFGPPPLGVCNDSAGSILA